ncbi:MAG TPA: M28 family peptidase [Gemmatimonadaceae bacterium]|jgi:Zn-dependent M28 family amino/carboxypeptidase
MKTIALSAAVFAAAMTLAACGHLSDRFARPKTAFNGDSALSYTKQHLAVGPRTPGTPAHDSAAAWIVSEMRKRTDSVIVQKWTQTTRNGSKLVLENILARFNPQATQRVLYLTHWDTRPVADEDRNLGNRARPILGANDGASGVGLFVALADVFKKTPPSVGVDLLFTDGEDWGDFDADSTGKVWPDALFGSQYFAQHPPSPDYQPLFGVLFDMIGATDLHLWQEPNSIQRAPEVVSRVWNTAKSLGYGAYFHDEPGQALIDDQVPLQNRGWHVIDLVDWPYGGLPPNAGPNDPPNPNYHHTLEDTIDKVSARSLQIVGDVAVALVK